MVQLKRALDSINQLQQLCAESKNVELMKISEQLNPCFSLIQKLDKELQPEPPVTIGKGKVIAVEGNGSNKKATVFFNGIGNKSLLLRFAKLKIVS